MNHRLQIFHLYLIGLMHGSEDPRSLLVQMFLELGSLRRVSVKETLDLTNS